MTRECCGKVMSLLTGTNPNLLGGKELTRISLLSAEGRVLSAIIQNKKTIMKDIPHITGISFRSCFEIIGRLSALGIIEKHTDSSDRRAIIFNVVHEKLCENVCCDPSSSNSPHVTERQNGKSPS